MAKFWSNSWDSLGAARRAVISHRLNQVFHVFFNR